MSCHLREIHVRLELGKVYNFRLEGNLFTPREIKPQWNWPIATQPASFLVRSQKHRTVTIRPHRVLQHLELKCRKIFCQPRPNPPAAYQKLTIIYVSVVDTPVSLRWTQDANSILQWLDGSIDLAYWTFSPAANGHWLLIFR